MNKVSVLIPSFNNAHYIEQAIDSCLQHMSRPEVVVVDDGSSDQTWNVLNAYRGNDAVKLIRVSENRGKVAAFNRAYSESTGDPITLLASDDLLLKGRDFLSHVPILQKRAQFWLSNYVEINTEDGYTRRRVTKKVRWPKILEENFYPGGAIAFNRFFGDMVFPLPDKCQSEDYFMALVACLLDCEQKVEEEVLLYRRHCNGTWGEASVDKVISLLGERCIRIIKEFEHFVLERSLAQDPDQFCRQIQHALDYNRAVTSDRMMYDGIRGLLLPLPFSLKARVRVFLGPVVYAQLKSLFAEIGESGKRKNAGGTKR